MTNKHLKFFELFKHCKYKNPSVILSYFELKVSVAANIGYCIVLILMSWTCGGPTFSMDWRLEAIFWNGLPMLVGLALIFPNFFDIFKKQNSHPEKEMKGKTKSKKKAMLSMDTINSMFECMVTFLACGCGFYGLSYCAGKLSTDVYLSTILLSGADILGYMAALTANSWGRTRLQGACFALAGCCFSPFIQTYCKIRFHVNPHGAASCLVSDSFLVQYVCLSQFGL